MTRFVAGACKIQPLEPAVFLVELQRVMYGWRPQVWTAGHALMFHVELLALFEVRHSQVRTV